jgi:integrase
MLAAGENPEWISKVMGHASVEMLFKVYSRFVPNLTRRDGQAFAGLVHSRMGAATDATNTDAALEALKGLSPEQLAAVLARMTPPNPSPSP